MRILAVGNSFAPLPPETQPVRWRATVEELRARGHVVRVLAAATDALEGADEGEDNHRELHFPPTGGLQAERHNAEILTRHLEGLRPDVVSWWIDGVYWPLLFERVGRLRTPAAATVLGGSLSATARSSRAVARLPARLRLPLGVAGTERALASVSRWLFAGESAREAAIEAGVPLERTRIVDPGVDSRAYAPRPVDPWQWRLLCVASGDSQASAIEALGNLPSEASLRISTTTSADTSPHSLSDLHASSARVELDSRARTADFYGAGDVLLLAGGHTHETNAAALEAFSVGMPVIVDEAGGPLIALENCLVSGAAGLEGTIKRLAGDPRLRERMRDGGFRTAAQLDARHFLDAVEHDLVAAAKA